MANLSAEAQSLIDAACRIVLGGDPSPETIEAARRRLVADVPAPAATNRVPDVNLLLHQGRGALLHQVPKGADVFLSAGCAGLWFFEWIEACYGKPRVHIGLEYYTPKPEGLPDNVQWIENTCSDMSGVADASCDIVFSGQNYEHLWPDELLGFFLESARVTKPGGLLVIDSPNRAITEALRTWSHPEHTVEATPAEAEHLLDLAGFDVTARKGVWLGRDPVTKAILPFDAAQSGSWSANERLIVGATSADDSFIWWLEARRAERAPDRGALRDAVDAIFEKAWPERLSRMSSHVGTPVERGGEEWIEADTGVSGALVFGPYVPLRAGRYACEFHLEAEGPAGPGPDAQCDVFLNRLDGPLVARDLVVDPGGTRVRLEFELGQLEFGVQFRCIGFGSRPLRCRRRVDLIEIA